MALYRLTRPFTITGGIPLAAGALLDTDAPDASMFYIDPNKVGLLLLAEVITEVKDAEVHPCSGARARDAGSWRKV